LNDFGTTTITKTTCASKQKIRKLKSNNIFFGGSSSLSLSLMRKTERKRDVKPTNPPKFPTADEFGRYKSRVF